MRSSETALRRANLNRIHRDQMRPLRVLEALDTGAIFEKSPVEIKEGYIVSDRDTGELFLTLTFRCLSQVPLASLDIRILLYRERLCVPYQKLSFRYSWEDATFGARYLNGRERKEKGNRPAENLECGEEFGQGIYIPLPESYFKRMQIELVGAAYGNGRYEKLGLIAGKRTVRFPELDGELRQAYGYLNIFEKEEQSHPIRVLPQEGENVWLCCCGHKNPAKRSLCEACGRDKEWQLANLSLEQLEKAKQGYEAGTDNRILHDKSDFPQNRYMETKEEAQEKDLQSRKAMQRITARDEAVERRYDGAALAIMLCVGGCILGILLATVVPVLIAIFLLH